MEFRKQTTYTTPMGTTKTIEIRGDALSDAEVRNNYVNNAIQAVAAVVAFLNALLFLRVLFGLFDVARTGFIASLYSITEPLVRPFQQAIPSGLSMATTGSSIDSPAIIAMIVITLLGWLASSIIGLAYRPLDHDL